MTGLAIEYQLSTLLLVAVVAQAELETTYNSPVEAVVVGTGAVFLVREVVAVQTYQQSSPFSPVLVSLRQ
jgi:hypothetical protein